MVSNTTTTTTAVGRWLEISFDASWSAFEDKIFLTSSYAYMLELVACILTPLGSVR